MWKSRNFENKKIYHLYNRGVAKQKIFQDPNDHQRLLDSFAYYLDRGIKQKISEINKTKLTKILSSDPKKPLVSIVGYCLMPNHLHFIVQQLRDGGISQFMQDSLNSYSRYYNTKHERVGPIFQSRFKSVEIEDDEQLIHLSRYVHINPYVANITDDLKNYPWSSLKLFIKNKKTRLCNPKIIIKIMGSIKEYKDFVCDYADYTKKLLQIDNLLLD